MLFAALFTLHMAKYITWIFKLRHIDGPLPLPVLGNFYMSDALAPTKFIKGLSKKFGKTFTYWPGITPMVVLLEPSHVRQVLTDTRTFVKGKDYSEKFSQFFGLGLVTSEGAKHKKDRSMLARFFVRTYVESYMPVFNKQTNNIYGELIDSLSEKELEKVDVSKPFLDMTNRVFVNFFCGADLSATEESQEFSRWINHLFQYGLWFSGASIIFGFPVFGNPLVVKIKNMKKEFFERFSRYVDERKKLRAEGGDEPDDCLKVLLDADTTDEDLSDHIITLIGAGHDTTGLTLSSAVHLLAKHPETQKKLRDEIKVVMGERKEITATDLKNLKYLAMVIKETLRMVAVVPFLNRTVTKDITIGGANRGNKPVFLPKGSTVLVSMSNMNRSSDVWEDPSEFKPERFEKIGDQNMALGYIPFSYGTRNCIGNTFATIEASVALCLFMQKYRAEPVPGFKPKFKAGITMTLGNGMMVKVVKDPL